jgi:uncharacterized protein with HEPN domain
MPKDDQILLRHMLEAALKARDFIQGHSRADLDSNEMLALAVIRLLEVVGEAARSLSKDLRDPHPEVAWKQITGTRDRLLHGYFDIDFDIVWAILTKDLPQLIPVLENLLSQEESK